MSTGGGEAPPSSFDQTPSINNTITHSKAEPKPIEITDHNVASSSATTTNNNDHGGALALSKLIHQDLISMKDYMDHVNLQINQAFDKFEELQTRGNPEAELQQLKLAVAKLKAQIPSQLKIRSAYSNPHRNPWPDVNKTSNEMMQNLYKEQKFEHTTGSKAILEAFRDLSQPLQKCLLCLCNFPPMAIITRRAMIYCWIGERFLLGLLGKNRYEKGLFWVEDIGNEIFDELIAKGFIEPVYQKCSLAADSGSMSLPVHSVLMGEAGSYGYRPRYFMEQHDQFADIYGDSCVINVNEAIIDGGPQLFEKMKRLRILYLGRWQSSATHHIEVADTKVLYGVKNMHRLRFLSLRGISLIIELPSFISELTSLKILDLRACHNLEVIPDRIGLLKRLTHLDMSECYFLEYMPNSLANLSSLEVLKGFFIGETKYKKRPCNLEDLSGLQWLRKLNIYTTMKDFPTESHLRALEKFRALRKLTISWGGCSSVTENDVNHLERLLTIHPGNPPPAVLPSTLQKLDLQCFRGTSPPNWLRPTKLKQLKKLYISGGQLSNLGQSHQKLDDEDLWRIEILRLKYLSELEMDWEELKVLFPKLIYMHKVECPKLTRFPFVESVGWMNIKEGRPVERNGIMNLETF